MKLSDWITDEAQLRQILAPPRKTVADKYIDYLDDTARRFIANAPYLLLASHRGGGITDVSPRGDQAGFVQILDNQTLAIPERRGNNRADTLINVLTQPDVGLIFLIPGITTTLRIAGRAAIARDEWLLQTMAVKGRVPQLAIIIQVKQVMAHCGKSAVRAGLWQPQQWHHKNVPGMAEMVVAHSGSQENVEQLQQYLDESLTQRLY